MWLTEIFLERYQIFKQTKNILKATIKGQIFIIY